MVSNLHRADLNNLRGFDGVNGTEESAARLDMGVAISVLDGGDENLIVPPGQERKLEPSV